MALERSCWLQFQIGLSYNSLCVIGFMLVGLPCLIDRSDTVNQGQIEILTLLDTVLLIV